MVSVGGFKVNGWFQWAVLELLGGRFEVNGWFEFIASSEWVVSVALPVFSGLS